MPSEETEEGSEAPKPTGVMRVIHLTGMLLPWKDGGPWSMHVNGSSLLYVPIFKDADELRAFMILNAFSYDKIKQIEDHEDFLASLRESLGEHAPECRLAVNPYYTGLGRVRWTELAL